MYLPKKGGRSNCRNCREMTLLSIRGKIFIRILRQSMKDIVDPHIQGDQEGFMQNHSYVYQIATLKSILNNLKSETPLFQSNLRIIFETVFLIGWAAKHFRMLEKPLRLIQDFYQGSNCGVSLEGHVTIKVQMGVKRGCQASPFLFSLIID